MLSIIIPEEKQTRKNEKKTTQRSQWEDYATPSFTLFGGKTTKVSKLHACAAIIAFFFFIISFSAKAAVIDENGHSWLRPAGSDPRVGDGLAWNTWPMAFKYTFLHRMQRF